MNSKIQNMIVRLPVVVATVSFNLKAKDCSELLVNPGAKFRYDLIVSILKILAANS